MVSVEVREGGECITKPDRQGLDGFTGIEPLPHRGAGGRVMRGVGRLVA